MLKRKSYLLSTDQEVAHPALLPATAPESEYQAWRAKLTAVPRYCTWHKSTKLRVLGSKCGFRLAYRPSHPDEPIDYCFTLAFFCPACICAYALCPPEFHETSFKTFETPNPGLVTALAKAREFVAQVNERDSGFALLVGPPGVGKTRLACNIIRNLRNHDSLYVRQGTLTSELRATYGAKNIYHYRRSGRPDEYDEEDSEPTLLESLQQVAFLVLDEIGCAAMANDERLLLDELLKHRYEHRKPTILISNLPLTGSGESPGLKQFLGDALTDRIKEASGNGKFILQFRAGSFRRTVGENYLNR